MSSTVNPPSRSPSPTPSINDTTSSCGYQSPSPATHSGGHEVFQAPSFRKRPRPRPRPVPAKPGSGAWADAPKPDLGPKGDGLDAGEHWGGTAPGDGTVLAPSSGTVLGRRRKGKKRPKIMGTYAAVEAPAAPGAKAEGPDAAVVGGVDAATLGLADEDRGGSGSGSVVSEAAEETAMSTPPVPRGCDGLPAPARRACPRPPLRWQTPRKPRQDTSSMRKSGKRRHVESDDEEEEEVEEED